MFNRHVKVRLNPSWAKELLNFVGINIPGPAFIWNKDLLPDNTQTKTVELDDLRNTKYQDKSDQTDLNSKRGM